MNNERYRVIILDDDYELGVLLQEYLQHAHKCLVTYVNSEADFWANISQQPYDILFLDYKLPGTTGLEILARMGEAGITIPTVMMTGEGSENVAARAIQSGALDYLVKGEYSFTALPPLIQKAVRLREMQRAMQQYLDQIRYQATLLDNMRDAVVVWELNGAITYWNAAAEQLYGAPAASRLGQPVEQVYFPCFDPPIALPSSLPTGSLQLERRILSSAGTPESPTPAPRWVSAHITVLYSQVHTGEPIGYMNVSRDITAIKLAETALQRRLDGEKLISTISNQFVNLPRADIEQGITAALERVARFIQVDYAGLHRRAEDRLVLLQTYCSQSIADLPAQLHQDIPLDAAAWLGERLQRLETISVSRLAELPAGTLPAQAALQQLGLQSLIAIPLAHTGSLFGLLSFASTREQCWSEDDIYVLKTVSELITNALVQKDMEDQLLAAQTRLAQSTRLASIGELASGVAHQISNPLTTIIADAQLLTHQLDSAHPGRESADAILQAGWRAQQVINELMKFSQPAQAAVGPVSLNQTIEQALLLASAHMQASGVRLAVDLAPGLPEITGNPRQLTDLWVILLLLARSSFTDSAGHTIQIITRTQGSQSVAIEFSDDGTPVPPEEYDTIFEPHLLPTRAGRGAGIELSLCREIVRQNRGEISVSGQENATTFHISFPIEGL